MGADFTFKHFAISQDRCAMKVGTDGVLLGAWARGGRRILDVGTGTGLIALMMAQRFPDARVDALEIDADAAEQAASNVAQSPFAGRIRVVRTALQDYRLPADSPVLYDAIVSNPPYYPNSLVNPDPRRTVARHDVSLPMPVLLRCSARLLAPEGCISLVCTAQMMKDIIAEAFFLGFRCLRRTVIATREGKNPSRALLELARGGSADEVEEHRCLTDKDGNRTEWYDDLTKDFYIR